MVSMPSFSMVPRLSNTLLADTVEGMTPCGIMDGIMPPGGGGGIIGYMPAGGPGIMPGGIGGIAMPNGGGKGAEPLDGGNFSSGVLAMIFFPWLVIASADVNQQLIISHQRTRVIELTEMTHKYAPGLVEITHSLTL